MKPLKTFMTFESMFSSRTLPEATIQRCKSRIMYEDDTFIRTCFILRKHRN
jgi:hypothetical protein